MGAKKKLANGWRKPRWTACCQQLRWGTAGENIYCKWWPCRGNTDVNRWQTLQSAMPCNSQIHVGASWDLGHLQRSLYHHIYRRGDRTPGTLVHDRWVKRWSIAKQKDCLAENRGRAHSKNGPCLRENMLAFEIEAWKIKGTRLLTQVLAPCCRVDITSLWIGRLLVQWDYERKVQNWVLEALGPSCFTSGFHLSHFFRVAVIATSRPVVHSWKDAFFFYLWVCFALGLVTVVLLVYACIFQPSTNQISHQGKARHVLTTKWQRNCLLICLAGQQPKCMPAPRSDYVRCWAADCPLGGTPNQVIEGWMILSVVASAVGCRWFFVLLFVWLFGFVVSLVGSFGMESLRYAHLGFILGTSNYEGALLTHRASCWIVWWRNWWFGLVGGSPHSFGLARWPSGVLFCRWCYWDDSGYYFERALLLSMTAGLGRFTSFCEGIGCGVCLLFARGVLFVFCVVVCVWRFRLTVSWTQFHRLRREYVFGLHFASHHLLAVFTFSCVAGWKIWLVPPTTQLRKCLHSYFEKGATGVTPLIVHRSRQSKRFQRIWRQQSCGHRFFSGQCGDVCVSFFGFWICVQIVGLLIEFMYIGTFCKWCIFYDINFFLSPAWKFEKLVWNWPYLGRDKIRFRCPTTILVWCLAFSPLNIASRLGSTRGCSARGILAIENGSVQNVFLPTVFLVVGHTYCGVVGCLCQVSFQKPEGCFQSHVTELKQGRFKVRNKFPSQSMYLDHSNVCSKERETFWFFRLNT